MDLGLHHKVIIVTGGTKGIGGAISKAIAAEGGIAVFIARSNEEGISLQNEMNTCNQEAFFIQADLTKQGNCEKVVAMAVEKYGRIDGLVNNAGRNDNVGLEMGTIDRFTTSLNENLLHYYEMAHYCLPELKKTKGSILNISSKVALTGQGGTSGYAAAKGAQLALTREWATELLPFGIRVNAILPAEVMTPLYRNWLHSFKDPIKKQREIEQNIPLGKRMTTAEEIASLAVFLISEKSAHTTGQFLSPDGGYVHLDRSIT
ncbi:SDR family oxidoreductase [Imtechella halotolerans]|uniref:Short chain dehydrogenase n=1 Tax=Imtechella halotolerans K1 TaxID=946077 RepID=I0WDE2_9FLAO|nr:SDR family oxidoreductase [Imtechella halotolerans]EID74408.1 short chain dehydrogenase [Imtechella halotolerans K1]WMQ62237.1 SDR family oxidoreductase [Imtechella halotolerans]